jgi:hypothetical protein
MLAGHVAFGVRLLPVVKWLVMLVVGMQMTCADAWICHAVLRVASICHAVLHVRYSMQLAAMSPGCICLALSVPGTVSAAGCILQLVVMCVDTVVQAA